MDEEKIVARPPFTRGKQSPNRAMKMSVDVRKVIQRVLAASCIAFVTSAVFVAFEEHQELQPVRHLRVGGQPHQIVPMRLYLGVQPGPADCPRGMYRPSGVGIKVGECEFCPRGVYGDSPGLVSKDCTAKCPKGTYNDKLGARSILGCKPCPAGVYGASTGLTTSQCSGPCPNGKYSMVEGLQSLSDCIDCPSFYRGPQGYRGNDVTMENGGGYPCDRYQYGKTILDGRDANNEAWLKGYLSEVRRPTNAQVNDNTTP